MNVQTRLEEWLDRISHQDVKLRREDLCFMMVQSRHLIELGGGRKTYPTISFFVDWLVHSELDQNQIGVDTLVALTKEVAANFSVTRTDVTTEVSRIIGSPKLRSEFKELYDANGLSTILFDYRENWKNCFVFLTWFLRGQPVRFPAENTKLAARAREQLSAIRRPHNIVVEQLEVVDFEGVVHWRLLVSSDKPNPFPLLAQAEISEAPTAFESG